MIYTSKTARHRNIRIMSSIAAMFSDHKIWLQNVTHPYIEEHDPQRDVYVEPAEQFNLLRDTYLELLNPLY